MRPRALVYLASRHVRVDIVEGGRFRSAHAALESEFDASVWSTGRDALSAAVRKAASSLGIDGVEAFALYANPTCAVDLHRSPASRSDAALAAELAIREAAPHVVDGDPISIEPLGRDEAGEPRNTHILSCADTTPGVEAVAEVIEQAGLQFAGAIPARAATIAKAMTNAVATWSGDTRADLRIDDDYATLTAQSNGRVLLCRVIDLGVNRFLDAISTFEGRGSGSASLDRDDALKLLLGQGIPQVDEPLAIRPELSGADVLPLIQPALQRLVVEIKQSLRFSLSEAQRAELTLHLHGAGASIPRLADIIARETELSSSGTSGEHENELSVAEHEATISIANRSSLVPPEAMTAHVDRKFRKGLACGAALTALVLVADAAWNLHVSHTMDTHIHSLAEVASAAGSARQTLETVEEQWAETMQAARHISEVTPPQAHWGAWLADVSRMTPKAIQLMHIGGEVQQGDATVRLNGVARGESAETSRLSITHFVETLRGSPLVSNVEIGGIRRGDGDSEHDFELMVSLLTTRVTPPIGEEKP